MPKSQPAKALQAAPQGMTYEEFLAWCDEDTRAEWVAGEVITGYRIPETQAQPELKGPLKVLLIADPTESLPKVVRKPNSSVPNSIGLMGWR